MGNIFCVEFQRARYHWKIWFDTKSELLRGCKLKSSKIFLKSPETFVDYYFRYICDMFTVWQSCITRIKHYCHCPVWNISASLKYEIRTIFSERLDHKKFLYHIVDKCHAILWCHWCFGTSQWRHNGLHGVSNHQPHHCLLSRLFGCRSKKTSNIRVTGLCAGNSPGISEFPAQMASNAENVSILWRHHDKGKWHLDSKVTTGSFYFRWWSFQDSGS